MLLFEIVIKLKNGDVYTYSTAVDLVSFEEKPAVYKIKLRNTAVSEEAYIYKYFPYTDIESVELFKLKGNQS